MAKTFYHSPTDQPTGTHAADIEKLADVTPPSESTDFTITGINTSGKIVAAFTSAANEPGSAAWPTGDYLVELDVPAMDSSLTFGLLTQGTAPGHLARVAATLNADLETVAQAATAFSTPGLKSIPFSSQTWASGSSGDRVEALVAAVKVFGHGSDSITIRTDGDGLISGPWSGGGNQTTGVQAADAEVASIQSDNVNITRSIVFDTEVA